MKNRTVLKGIIPFVVVLIFACVVPKAKAQIVEEVAGEVVYDAKAYIKKALTEGKVDVISCKMEKSTDAEGVGKIIITGTALYTTAKLRKKAFKDLPGFGLKAYFYSENGMKLKGHLPIFEFGIENQPVNVQAKKPFPFRSEGDAGGYFDQNLFDKAAYCIIRGWNTIDQVSSKDDK